jgi:hypothetical protein
MGNYLAPATIGGKAYLAPATPTVGKAATPVRFDFTAYYAIFAPVFESTSGITSIEVTPATVAVKGGAGQQFSVLVQGESGANLDVVWTATAGIISQTGAFNAPQATNADQVITVRATSVQDSKKWSEVTVTVMALPTVSGVSITPTGVELTGGAMFQFAANVQGTNEPSQAVTWTTTLGQISDNGTITAPDIIGDNQVGTVTATSELDPSKSRSVTFVVLARPVIVTPQPPTQLPANYGISVARTVTVKVDSLAFTAGPYWKMDNPKHPKGIKDPNSTIDISFNWKEWLQDASDTIDSFVFLLGDGLRNVGDGHKDGIVTVFIAGGDVPGSIPVTCRIRTKNSPPRVEDRTVFMAVEDR